MTFYEILRGSIAHVQEQIYKSRLETTRIINNEHGRSRATLFLFIIWLQFLIILTYILTVIDFLLICIYKPSLMVYTLPILLINILISPLALFFIIIFSIYWGIKFLTYTLDNSVVEIRPEGEWFFKSYSPFYFLIFQLSPNLKLREAINLAKNYGIWCSKAGGIDLDAYNDLADCIDENFKEGSVELEKHNKNLNLITDFLPNFSGEKEESYLVLWCRAMQVYLFYIVVWYPYLTTFKTYYSFVDRI